MDEEFVISEEQAAILMRRTLGTPRTAELGNGVYRHTFGPRTEAYYGDDLVFWARHNRLPGFECVHEQMLYEAHVDALPMQPPGWSEVMPSTCTRLECRVSLPEFVDRYLGDAASKGVTHFGWPALRLEREVAHRADV